MGSFPFASAGSGGGTVRTIAGADCAFLDGGKRILAVAVLCDVRTLEVLHDHYGTGEFVTHPALRRMVDQGLLGTKSGRGFYSYDGN